MKKNKVFVLMMGCFLSFSPGSFSQPPAHNLSAQSDTQPGKNKEKKIRDLDEALNEVDRGFSSLDKVNLEKVKKELDAAMKNMDAAQLKLDIENAMKEVDMTKLQAQLQKTIKEVDAQKLKVEMEKALASVDIEKLKKQLDVEKLNLREAEEEMKKIRPQLENSMDEARKSLERAKAELKDYKAFLNDLEKDGLIDTKSNYSIIYTDGSLIINGQKQPRNISDKYDRYLKNKKNFNIEKSGNNFDINNDK